MTTEIDIYRSAHALIDQHGEGAAIQAAMKADAMLDKKAIWTGRRCGGGIERDSGRDGMAHPPGWTCGCVPC